MYHVAMAAGCAYSRVARNLSGKCVNGHLCRLRMKLNIVLSFTDARDELTV